jgi:hypothetical protein
MSNLRFFNKEGDYLNVNYDSQSDMYSAKILFDHNSSDTFKTQCLYLLEHVEPFSFFDTDNLYLDKFQLFNEFGFQIYGSYGQSVTLTKIEAVNNDPSFYSKWLYSPDIEKKFKTGSEIVFLDSICEFTNPNQSYTIISSKKNAIMIISSLNNTEYNNLYNLLDITNTTVRIESINAVGVNNYINASYRSNLSLWSEPDFYSKLYDNRKLNLIDFSKNSGIVAISNHNMLDKIFYVNRINKFDIVEGEILKVRLTLKSNLPLVYGGKLTCEGNKVLFANKTPVFFKQGMSFYIPNASNSNYFSLAPLKEFDKNAQKTKYVIGDQVLFNSNIYECRQAHTSTGFDITPSDVNYWTRSLTYINTDTAFVSEVLEYAELYVASNVFEYQFNNLIPVTQRDDFFSFFGLVFTEENDDYVVRNTIPGNHIEVKFYTGNLDITKTEMQYQKLMRVSENLSPEINNNISKRHNEVIVFTDIDENGIKITINGNPYTQEYTPHYVAGVLNLSITIDKTLRAWYRKYYFQLFRLGIEVRLSHTIVDDDALFDSLNIATTYPNVPLVYSVQVGTTASYYIPHSSYTFYDLGSYLSVKINGKVYDATGSDIYSILSSWLSKHKAYLETQDIYASVKNNRLLFNLLDRNIKCDIIVTTNKNNYTGEILWDYKSLIIGNIGSIITSNEAVLKDTAISLFSEHPFSTGMIVGVNNTIYSYNNQEYNILALNDKHITFSYQGPFWTTGPIPCSVSPFTIIAFDNGFDELGCLDVVVPPDGGGEYAKTAYSQSFTVKFASQNEYENTSLSASPYANLDGFTHLTYLSEENYLYSFAAGYVVTIDPIQNEIIAATKLDNYVNDNVNLLYNPVNNYMYAVTKDTINIIDPFLTVNSPTRSYIAEIHLTLGGGDYITDATIDRYGRLFISKHSGNILVWNSNNLTTAPNITFSSGTVPEKITYDNHLNTLVIASLTNTEYIVHRNTDIIAGNGTHTTFDAPSMTYTSLFYCSANGVLYALNGQSLYSIDNNGLNNLSITIGEEAYIAYNPAMDLIYISYRDTDGAHLTAIDLDNNVVNTRNALYYGEMTFNSLTGEVYMTSIAGNMFVCFSPDKLELTFSQSYPHPIIAPVFVDANSTVWYIQPAIKTFATTIITPSTVIEQSELPTNIDVNSSSYGTLDKDYVVPTMLQLDVREMLRKPRLGYSNKAKSKYYYKWVDDQTPELFLYDFSGNQLTSNGVYTYTGELPLPTPVLSRVANADLTKVKDSTAQQTIFDKVSYELPHLDSASDINYEPEPIELFIGYNSNQEGSHENLLEMYESRIHTKTINSSYIHKDVVYFQKDVTTGLGLIIIDQNSMAHFNEDDFRIGDWLKINLTDNTNLFNKYQSYNNGKVFKIKTIGMKEIVVEILDDDLLPESTVIMDYPTVGDITNLDITFSVVDKLIGKFRVAGETEIEDIRFQIELNNTGKNVYPNESFIFKDTDISEQGVDWTYLNAKRKEMIMMRHEIYPYVGSYKALINAINYFGYNDLTLNEYYLETKNGNLKKLEVPDIFDNSIKGWDDSEFAKGVAWGAEFQPTNLFNLSYNITDKLGNNVQSYSVKEVIIKLQGLKKWMQKNVIPVTHKIKDITGRADMVASTSVRHQVMETHNFKFNTKHEVIKSQIKSTTLAPISGNSKVYSVAIEFTPDTTNLFSVHVRTYQTYDEWDALKPYIKNDRVRYSNRLFKCVKENSRLISPTKYDTSSEWYSLGTYILGDIVRYNRSYYICSSPEYVNTSEPSKPIIDNPWTDITEWLEIDAEPIQTIEQQRTDVSPLLVNVDAAIDPYINVVVTSYNDYGQGFTHTQFYYVVEGIAKPVDLSLGDGIGPFKPLV